MESTALETIETVEAEVVGEETRLLAVYQEQARALEPLDERTLRSCAVFIEECKLAERRVEAKRKAYVDPLNKLVKDKNAELMPVRAAFETAWRTVDEKVGRYQHACRQAAEAEQRRLLQQAEGEQLKLAERAETARQAAETARVAGNVLGAQKALAKAETLEAQAACVVAPVVASVPSTIGLGDATLSTKGPKKEWLLTGWDKAKPIPVLDPRLQGVDLHWILKYCDVNPVRLNKAYESGEPFPKPFTEGLKFGGSTLRSGR